MRLKKRIPSGREKDEAAVKLLEELREKVYSSNISSARHAAFNLSWMQEDGYEILQEALVGNSPRSAKGAAAYGLRKMRGRMKNQAFSLLEGGLKHSNADIRQACAHALRLEKEAKSKPAQPKPPAQGAAKHKPKGKFKITEISHKSERERPRHGRRRPPHISRFNR